MTDMLVELQALCAGLDGEGIDYALCGGLAVAVHAFPRATLDIDILIEPDSLEHSRQLAHRLGYRKDVGSMELKNGSVRLWRLTKVTPGQSTPLVLDFVLVTEPMRFAWESRQRVSWQGGEISVVSPEGLIAMKELRLTGQDRDDIEHLRRTTDED